LTFGFFRQILGIMKKLLIITAFSLFLVSCATKPPVQEMAEARSAIERAQQLENGNDRAYSVLKSAEQSLKEAAEAMDSKNYETARRKAIDAKRQAQLAAKIKNSTANH